MNHVKTLEIIQFCFETALKWIADGYSSGCGWYGKL